MGKYQGYQKYKDSGVEWLGEIPDHWEILTVKRITKSHKQGFYTNQSYVDDGVKLARITDIDDFANVSFEKMPYVEVDLKDEKAFEIKHGDFLFARSGTIGRFGLVRNPEKSIFASYLICFRFTNINPEYLRFYFSSLFFQECLLSTLHGGANQNVHAENIKEQFISIPPLEEQEKIARFLDYKTKQIDDLIAKKETLIQKLDEKRTSLISYAVTKGLDVNVPMKDSGIEWLGEIPKHWEVKRLKFLVTKIGSGKTPKGGSEVYIDSGIMLIRSQNVYDDGLRLDDVVYIDDDIDNIQANSRVFPNDILLNITGASIGRTSLIPPNFGKANVNQHVCIFRPKLKEIFPQYLHLLFCSQQGKEQIFSCENGISREGLNFQEAGNLTFGIPPLQEQQKIAEYLDQKTAQIEEQKTKIQQAIELLKEYRTALITNAVTGKIDVRTIPIPN